MSLGLETGFRFGCSTTKSPSELKQCFLFLAMLFRLRYGSLVSLLLQVLRMRKYFDGLGDDRVARHGLKIGRVVLLEREPELKQRAGLLRGRGDFELSESRKAVPDTHQSVAVQVRDLFVRVSP